MRGTTSARRQAWAGPGGGVPAAPGGLAAVRAGLVVAWVGWEVDVVVVGLVAWVGSVAAYSEAAAVEGSRW